MNRPNRMTRRRMKANTRSVKPEPKKEKKTLAQMDDKELQDMINQIEYNRIKLPKSSHPRIMAVMEEYTRRITLLRDLLNTRKSMVKKDESNTKSERNIPKMEK